MTSNITETQRTALDEWQPIETAPKDGSRVLVSDDAGNFDFARWHLDHMCGELDGWAPFTHWRPLPPPVREDIHPPAGPDEDTRDVEAIMRAWYHNPTWHEPVAQGAFGEDFAAAKQALTTIKDRVRHEEREAVCKWLRRNGGTGIGLAVSVERGAHTTPGDSE